MKTVEEQAKNIYQLLEMVYGTSPWTLEQVLIDIWQDQTDYFLLYDHDKLLGFLAIQDLAGEVEMTQIAILPSHQGLGLASQLMTHLGSIESDIFLEVRESNHRAQGLYQKFGFKFIGKRPDYYRNPIETALLMKREGKHDR
ncbi:ribosomal protein S18-alanine N-acetyltransferase [Streptococcus pyogenes]|uniref:ribosomal protein S18-alanine N-acetyltransferase n=1 Tax=Streptococcus pyogenes TaxID=1314 RepID=UPI00031716A8|nr:ribosomal protein S18-alanine N-acetyltransferase [Streptococcus pyogenes]ESA55307.1 ribosomal-protein-alanine acetyltransferase [Streptococcus pyogenes GA41394]MDA6091927.1 ribosomal protein S18-alanine N-acetyltransferase [Streptococcus pyogenes]MDA6096622.1 ribosomal protein S18-alanine N-acetyltransferase [Streptococcus pyogenes]MZX73495.1 ribosomal protein S18-alanine N-acetyltransferase [Streptococcus pyogenes]